MRSPTATKTIARYSRLRCLGWTVLVLLFAIGIFSEPIPSVAQLFRNRYEWLYPIAAITAFITVPYGLWLVGRAFLFGGKAVEFTGDRFILYLPWPKTVPLSSIKYVEGSQDLENAADYGPGPFPGTRPLGLLSRKYSSIAVSRVRLYLNDGSCTVFGTGLMQEECKEIAAAMAFYLDQRVRSPRNRRRFPSP